MEIALFISVVGLGLWAYYFNKNQQKEWTNIYSKAFKLLGTNKDMQKILLAGMYQRFQHEEGKKEDTPWDFEHFVGRVMEEYYGGRVEVTPPTNDGGIDFKLYKGDSLYLGQVKCHAPTNPVIYEPIAIIHSQMVKQGATGGILVTTSHYTPGAIEYCKSLNIELIDGEQFLQMWLETIEKAQTQYVTTPA